MGRVGAQFLTHLPDMIYIFSVGRFSKYGRSVYNSLCGKLIGVYVVKMFCFPVNFAPLRDRICLDRSVSFCNCRSYDSEICDARM